MKYAPSLGSLRDRLTIQGRTVAPDTFGDPVETWRDLGQVAARVEPVGGIETWRGERIEAEVTHSVTIRAWPGLTPKHRFILDGRILEIEGIRDMEGRGRWYSCQCREVLS